jgi:hypothetical protein
MVFYPVAVDVVPSPITAIDGWITSDPPMAVRGAAAITTATCAKP